MAKKDRQLKAVQAAKARKKRRSRRRRRVLVLSIEMIILVLLLGTAYVMKKYDKIQKVNIDKDEVDINEGAIKKAIRR